MSASVPLKVLHEAQGHTVTFEMVDGETYHGKLVEAEDNMNCEISCVRVALKDGSIVRLDNLYVKGSKVSCVILPDVLRNNVPVLNNNITMPGPAAGTGMRGTSRGCSRGRGNRRGGGHISMSRGGPSTAQ